MPQLRLVPPWRKSNLWRHLQAMHREILYIAWYEKHLYSYFLNQSWDSRQKRLWNSMFVTLASMMLLSAVNNFQWSNLLVTYLCMYVYSISTVWGTVAAHKLLLVHMVLSFLRSLNLVISIAVSDMRSQFRRKYLLNTYK